MLFLANPHLLPLLPVSVTEADTGGGPDGASCTFFAAVRLIFKTEEAAATPDRSFLFL